MGKKIDLDQKSLDELTDKEIEMLEEVVSDIGLFDCVVLDVPCSNTGVLSKRVEARFRISPKAIEKLTKTQSQLLERASDLIKDKGTICYSTCSIQKEENDELIHKFLKEKSVFRLEREKFTLPSSEEFGCDGGYTAILSKNK